MNLPRLDILLYSHDGRGIGHASRTVGIGMALRRLYPELKVLFASGTPLTNELRHTAPLDWLKLPAYETTVIQGKSKGTDGKSNYSDGEIGYLRAATLKHYVELYRPRIILADHSPRGKHRELLPALEATVKTDTDWILGVRGIIGKVKQVSSAEAAELFRKHYKGLLWYGDSSILSDENLCQLAALYGQKPTETGYVSRMSEIRIDTDHTSPATSILASTISIPWLGETGRHLIALLAEVIPSIPKDFGQWNIFFPKTGGQDDSTCVINRFNTLPNCLARPFGPEYHSSLAQSKTAVIYGGYNSLTDVLCTRTPSLVLMRGMQDAEQQEHLRLLTDKIGSGIISLAEESATAPILRSSLLKLLHHNNTDSFAAVNLNGAEKAAHYLAALLGSP